MISGLLPVILAGGSGTRLWPLSRKLRPKQFLPLVDEQTMFQATLARLDGLSGLHAPFVVCNEAHRFLVAEQLREHKYAHQAIILEPTGKDTAPAIALAALYAQQIGLEEAMLLVLPADHVISNINAFQQALNVATKLAGQGRLVTFGIVPKHAETGYGYIQHDGGSQVLRFVEKPDQTTAEHFFESGEYLWNSGMFLFQVTSYLAALKRYAPDVLTSCRQAMAQPTVDNDFIRVDKAAFEACSSISVDYAIMEKTTHAAVVPLDCGWSDVGAWNAVWDLGKKDTEGNVMRGDVAAYQAKRNLVYTEQRLVALLGVEDLLVIDTKDATLVAHRNHAQEIKGLVGQLETRKRPELLLHREVYRPWGSYDSVDHGERFQVKRIVVKPGARLSLQKHHHRAEHWVVVKGTAEVRCGDKILLLTENQSTYIPLGEVHQLANPGKVPLEMIEVQSGSYLEEDDIVRLEDIYGREIEE